MYRAVYRSIALVTHYQRKSMLVNVWIVGVLLLKLIIIH